MIGHSGPCDYERGGESKCVACRAKSDLELLEWLELQAVQLGTPNQTERWHANVLPEDELTQLARAELFKAFDEMPRWREIKRTEVKHEHDCLGKDGRHVGFETCLAAELGDQEWAVLKQIEATVDQVQKHAWLVRGGGRITVQSQTHWAECATCHAETCRSSAKVSIEWAGRVLTREYAL